MALKKKIYTSPDKISYTSENSKLKKTLFEKNKNNTAIGVDFLIKKIYSFNFKTSRFF